jgi:hypothetical protein
VIVYARSVRDCHKDQRVALVVGDELIWGTVRRVAAQYVYIDFDDESIGSIPAKNVVIGVE